MGRGLERRHILATSADKRDFIDRLEAGLSETGTQCLAWALMGNHYHLLLRAGSNPLADLIRKLLGGFATAYNRRHSRVGYVFQNRYKSVLCNEAVYLLATAYNRRHSRVGYVFQNRYKSVLCNEAVYLLELVRYIHLNPLRAKIVENLSILDRYRWTGHAVLMGNQRLDWQHTETVLEHFGHDTMAARCGYRAFMMKGMSTAPEVDLGGGGLIRVKNWGLNSKPSVTTGAK
jgi:REP element-mobilizing transposase RayT